MTVAPHTVGFSSERLSLIDDHLRRKYVEPGKIPFALTLVARKGEVAHLGAG